MARRFTLLLLPALSVCSRVMDNDSSDNIEEIVSCFKASPSQGMDYCSSLTPLTTIIGTTPIVIATASTTYTMDIYTVTTTATSTVTQIVPSSTVKEYGFFGDKPPPKKRAHDIRSIAPPSCVKTQSFPPDLITSACSSFGVPARTVSLTYTAPTATSTNGYCIPATVTTNVTVWETTTTTISTGVTTAWIPARTPVNLDFEQGLQQNNWEYSSSEKQGGWNLSMAMTEDAHNRPTWAFSANNTDPRGGKAWIKSQITQYYRFRSGPTYRVSFSAKTTAFDTTNNTASNIFFKSITGDGRKCGGPWNPLTNGVELGNGWYRYSMDFVVPQAVEGECNVYTGFMSNRVWAMHYVDNYSVERLD